MPLTLMSIRQLYCISFAAGYTLPLSHARGSHPTAFCVRLKEIIDQETRGIVNAPVADGHSHAALHRHRSVYAASSAVRRSIRRRTRRVQATAARGIPAVERIRGRYAG